MYTFYATFDASSLVSYVPQVPILLPASSWARKGMKKPAIPDHVIERAADSGGFVASRIWGEYKYTLDAYVDWLGYWSPQWAACMDYCCEPELQANTEVNQQKTTDNAWDAWQRYKQVPWAWVPTIQGLYPADYRRHALQMKPLIDEMASYYADNPYWRVGIGTLCRREDDAEICNAVCEVLDVLPGIDLHLWGVKKQGLKTIFRTLPRHRLQRIKSSDSGAWHDMFKGNGKKMHAIAAQHGMNRQQYIIKRKLPAYIEGMEAITNESYQIVGEPDTTWLREQLRCYGYTLRVRVKPGGHYVYGVRRINGKLNEIYLARLQDINDEIITQKLGTPPAGIIPNLTLWDMEIDV